MLASGSARSVASLVCGSETGSSVAGSEGTTFSATEGSSTVTSLETVSSASFFSVLSS